MKRRGFLKRMFSIETFTIKCHFRRDDSPWLLKKRWRTSTMTVWTFAILLGHAVSHSGKQAHLDSWRESIYTEAPSAEQSMMFSVLCLTNGASWCSLPGQCGISSWDKAWEGMKALCLSSWSICILFDVDWRHSQYNWINVLPQKKKIISENQKYRKQLNISLIRTKQKTCTSTYFSLKYT